MSRLAGSTWGLDTPRGQDWRAQAECATGYDPDLWSSGRDDVLAVAVAICRRCPVLAQCYDWASSTPKAVVDTVAGGVLWVREHHRYGPARPAVRQPGAAP